MVLVSGGTPLVLSLALLLPSLSTRQATSLTLPHFLSLQSLPILSALLLIPALSVVALSTLAPLATAIVHAGPSRGIPPPPALGGGGITLVGSALVTPPLRVPGPALALAPSLGLAHPVVVGRDSAHALALLHHHRLLSSVLLILRSRLCPVLRRP